MGMGMGGYGAAGLRGCELSAIVEVGSNLVVVCAKGRCHSKVK
jgi:hypothetical protein